VTDPYRVAEFTQEAKDSMGALREKLSRTGLMRVDGTKDLKAIRERVSKLTKNPKLTDKGNIATDEEAIKATQDPDLLRLVDFSKAQKLDSVWSRYLEQGTNTNTPIQATFHCLVESGRTSCAKPNLQNPHRATGLRECFIPRKGHLFAACDYSTLELCTLAQVNSWLFQDSSMAQKLRDGADLHLHFASILLDIPYPDALERLRSGDREVKKTRQMAKVANFGYPGGMGAEAFRSYAKGYGLEITEQDAKALRDNWFIAWPEMNQYFQFVNAQMAGHGFTGKIVQFLTDRVRGDVSFTQACNSYFQGLAADGAKKALFEVSKRCYTDPKSPLYGSKPVMFIHDEIIIETPKAGAPEAADELAKVMREVMQEFTPDVPIKTDVALMDRWYKDAEELRSESGKLKVWRPPPKPPAPRPVKKARSLSKTQRRA
jgi:DNA polymerase I-like protein with 3'-5' exonuclease and polymerase domains